MTAYFLPKITGVLLGLSVLAYGIGWNYAVTYFGKFGAEYLLVDLPAKILLGYALEIVAEIFPIVFSIILYFLYIEEIDSKKAERIFLQIMGAPILILCMTIVLVIFFTFHFQVSESWKLVEYSSFLIVVLVSIQISLTFLMICRNLGASHYGQKSVTLGMFFASGFLLLWVVPQRLASIIALRDMDIEKTNLRAVYVENEDDPWGLLYSQSGRHCIVSLNDDPGKVEIRLIEDKEIVMIRKKMSKNGSEVLDRGASSKTR